MFSPAAVQKLSNIINSALSYLFFCFCRAPTKKPTTYHKNHHRQLTTTNNNHTTITTHARLRRSVPFCSIQKKKKKHFDAKFMTTTTTTTWWTVTWRGQRCGRPDTDTDRSFITAQHVVASKRFGHNVRMRHRWNDAGCQHIVHGQLHQPSTSWGNNKQQTTRTTTTTIMNNNHTQIERPSTTRNYIKTYYLCTYLYNLYLRPPTLHIHKYTYICTYIHLYKYICIYICMCVHATRTDSNKSEDT